MNIAGAQAQEIAIENAPRKVDRSRLETKNSSMEELSLEDRPKKLRAIIPREKHKSSNNVDIVIRLKKVYFRKRVPYSLTERGFPISRGS